MATAIAARKSIEHIGETKSVANHDHDMIHELSKRIDAVWRFDQYIANAGQDRELRDFWKELKTQEQRNVERLKTLIAHHIEKDCF